MIIGFQEFEFEERKQQIINDFINALLINDQIFIYSYDIFFLIDCFTITELRKLVELDILKVIYGEIGSAYFTGVKNNLKFGFGSYQDFGTYILGVENKLAKKSHSGLLNQAENDFLARIEATPHKIDKDTLIQRITDATKNDISNPNITGTKFIKSTNLNSVYNQDIIKILSIAHTNRALILGGEIEIKNIKLDQQAKQIVNSKFGPTFLKKIFRGMNKVDVFEEINNLKGLPNLGFLYISNIISLNDILTIRNSIDGKVFRIWYESQEYSKEETLKHVLNSVDNRLQNIITKHIRWFIPVVASVINPIGGVTASYANSFIVEKMLSGYHPNLFLDKVLRKNITRKEIQHRKKLTGQTIRKRKAKIGRNEPCICGSGKKYKRCCLIK